MNGLSLPSAARWKGQEVVAVLVGEERDCEVDPGNPGKPAEHQVLELGLRRGGHGDGVAIAAETGRDPEDIDSVTQGRCPPARLHDGASEACPSD